MKRIIVGLCAIIGVSLFTISCKKMTTQTLLQQEIFNRKTTTQWIAGGPKTTVDIRKSVAEGNLVILHVKSPTPDGKYLAIAEFFRVENNKIAEHWDVIQAAPDTSANPHPMF